MFLANLHEFHKKLVEDHPNYRPKMAREVTPLEFFDKQNTKLVIPKKTNRKIEQIFRSMGWEHHMA